MSNENKEKLEVELIKLSQLDTSRSSTAAEIKKLQNEILNSRINEVGFKESLQENVEVFSTQKNKTKLRKFLSNYPVVRLDMAYVKTSTYCLQLAFDATLPFEDQYQQVLPFLPYLVMVPEVLECPLKMTGTHIKIKEYNYGEEGLIELVIPKNKNQIWLCRTKHRVTSIIHKFDKWEDALKYIYTKHPYFK